MFKYTVNYENYVGESKTKTLRFNITETEMRELVKKDRSFSTPYLTALLEAVNDTEDDSQEAIEKRLELYEVIRKLVVYAYGEISSDGDSFLKNENIAEAFMQSAAYDAFMGKLFGDDGSATLLTQFFTHVFPAKFSSMFDDNVKPAAIASRI